MKYDTLRYGAYTLRASLNSVTMATVMILSQKAENLLTANSHNTIATEVTTLTRQ
jgi:hypothetical protein